MKAVVWHMQALLEVARDFRVFRGKIGMILGAESLRKKRIRKELEKTKVLHKSNNQEDRGDIYSKLCYNLESAFTYCIFPLPLDDPLAYKYLNIF